ncbi:tetratricopeptide repeat protein [Aliivibrio wodanis]|uniref:tetratricopeptide repeat protein n=1 Tax=Aliivibrio wodanis TaxID=80852 RepID=UPI00406D23F5
MRAKFLILLCFFCHSVFAEVDTDVVERYQQLSRWLETENADLEPIIRFYNQQQGKGQDTQEIAAGLYLQACIKFQNYQCALNRVDELLTLTLTQEKTYQLITLAVQLSFQVKKYDRALKATQQWKHSVGLLELKQKPSASEVAEIYTIAAYSASYLNHWHLSERYIKDALDTVATKNRYQFLLGIYQQTQAMSKEIALLVKLTGLYPEESMFWLRLAQNRLMTQQPKMAIAALSVLKAQDQLEEKQVILLAQLQLQENSPVAAYKTLEELRVSKKNQMKVNNLKLQTLLLSRQREKALQLLETFSQPSYLATKSQLAYAEGKWPLAVSLLQQQIDLEPKQEKWRLLKGIAYFELQQYSLAITEFQSLQKGKYKNAAQQWLSQSQYLSGSHSI